MVRVLIVDDRPDVRRRLRETLEADGMFVVSADSGFEAVPAARGHLPAVVLLSGQLDGAPEIAARLRRAVPDASLVMVGDEALALPFAELGAVGAVADHRSLARTVRGVARGEHAWTRATARSVLERLHRAPVIAPAVQHPALTTREREVLDLVAEGATNSAIAAALVLSPETVKSHVRSIRRKLGVRSRAEAVALVRRQAA